MIYVILKEDVKFKLKIKKVMFVISDVKTIFAI